MIREFSIVAGMVDALSASIYLRSTLRIELGDTEPAIPTLAQPIQRSGDCLTATPSDQLNREWCLWWTELVRTCSTSSGNDELTFASTDQLRASMAGHRVLKQWASDSVLADAIAWAERKRESVAATPRDRARSMSDVVDAIDRRQRTGKLSPNCVRVAFLPGVTNWRSAHRPHLLLAGEDVAYLPSSDYASWVADGWRMLVPRRRALFGRSGERPGLWSG